jgi:flagellar basal-body rod protein FlgG
MNQGIYSLSATMVNQLNRVDVLANNLANANTTAFKEDNLVEGSFNHYLDRLAKNDIEPTKLNIVNNTVPKIDGDYIKGDVGAVVTTGNRLDFALKDNETFFKVKDNNNQILLTRDGSFKNVGGFLSTSEGFRVLNADNEAIAIADGFEPQIALVKTKFENLDKIGNNNYKVEDMKKTTPIINNDPEMLQGAIEKSNVNSITTMVALIDSQRRLEQAQKAMTGIDDINQKLITKLGRR